MSNQYNKIKIFEYSMRKLVVLSSAQIHASLVSQSFSRAYNLKSASPTSLGEQSVMVLLSIGIRRVAFSCGHHLLEGHPRHHCSEYGPCFRAGSGELNRLGKYSFGFVLLSSTPRSSACQTSHRSGGWAVAVVGSMAGSGTDGPLGRDIVRRTHDVHRTGQGD
jgi:hypothetical protein